MRKPDAWLKTIDAYWISGGRGGYYCWCPQRPGGRGRKSCWLDRLAVEFAGMAVRIRMSFLPEGELHPDREPNRSCLVDDGEYVLRFCPAYSLLNKGLNAREIADLAEREAKEQTGKFFRLNGLDPFPETAELVRAIAARAWFLAKRGNA